MKPTPEDIFNLLDKAIAEKLADGWRLVHQFGYVGNKTCCAITAVPFDTKIGYWHGFALFVGIEVEDAVAITDGFDGWNVNKNSPYYSVGERLAVKYGIAQNP